MKYIYLIAFISIFQLLNSVELGGIKFAITEKMANDVLYHFYPVLNQKIRSMELADIHVETGVNIREIQIGITNFSTDKVKFSFKENGINLKISGLKAFASATVYVSRYIIPWHNNIHIDIQDFGLNINLRVFGKKVGNKLLPWAEFTQPPSHTIDMDVDIDGFMFGLNGALESTAKKMFKSAINEFIQNQSNLFLEAALTLIPTEIAVDSSKGLFIDYSLVDDIKMKNGYLEINSYAFLYNKNKSQTNNKKNFPLSLVSSITSIDNPNQIFVSQYSLNSALYTYFITSPLSLKVDVEDYILGLLLPTLFTKYSGKKFQVYLETTEPPTLDFEENYINGNIKGKLRINVEGKTDPVFV
jgi:hypothetical protein